MLPIFSGIQTNIYINADKINYNDVFTVLRDFYKYEIFISVDNKNLSKLSDVQNTNNVKIFVNIDKSSNTIIIISLLDNLVKGAGGQAIQNMNLMFDFKEHESLK